MSRICPQTGEKVVYLECQDCDDRLRCLSKSKAELARETGGIKSATRKQCSTCRHYSDIPLILKDTVSEAYHQCLFKKIPEEYVLEDSYCNHWEQ